MTYSARKKAEGDCQSRLPFAAFAFRCAPRLGAQGILPRRAEASGLAGLNELPNGAIHGMDSFHANFYCVS